MTILYWIAALSLFLIGLTAVVRWAEPRIAFHPSPGPTPPSDPFRRFEVVTTDQVRLAGWKAGIGEDRPVLLYLCGNAGNISDRTFLLTQAAACDIGVIAVNYRGTGESEGTPSEEGVYQDAVAVYDYLTHSEEISPSRIVVWGHSIGGAVACELARRRPCAGLILESTFLSAQAMARRMIPFLPLSLLMSYRLDNETAVAELDIPKLFLHGTGDPTVPAADTEALYRLAAGPKELWLIEGAGHNDLHETAGAAFFERICGFARRVTAP